MSVPARPIKKGYREPKLVVYGSLTELTAARSTGAMTDASKGGGNKTT
jgi:hypothetical protein